MFKAYCKVIVMGEEVSMPPVRLSGAEEIVNYVMLQRNIVHEIIIEDKEEYCIMHVIDGKIIHPKELSHR